MHSDVNLLYNIILEIITSSSSFVFNPDKKRISQGVQKKNDHHSQL
jgi:hypothetical protein